MISKVSMPAPNKRGVSTDLAPGAGREWLGKSVWQIPQIEISAVKSWPSITAMRYNASAGEGFWRGERNRLLLPLIPDDDHPSYLLQIDQGRPDEAPILSGALAFQPAG